jgi:signal transduction histidine kinase
MEAVVSAVENSNPWLAADLRDVASQKQVVAELTLARESADRARDEADRANLAKSRLLTAAIRELRQPLQSLSLLNDTLRRVVSGPESVDAVRQQGQVIGAMSRLLNTLLDISKRDRLRTQNGSGPVRTVAADSRPVATSHGTRQDSARP